MTNFYVEHDRIAKSTSMTELPKAQHDRIAKSTKMTELPKAHDLMNLI